MDNLEQYQNLANAIVIRACDDYKIGKMSDDEFKRFCRSGYFKILTKVNPEFLIEKMAEEREVYLYEKKKRYEKKHGKSISL